MKAPIGSVHSLIYLLHEDEADIKSISFKVLDADLIEVRSDYNCAEYDREGPKRMTVREARDLWKKKLAEWYWDRAYEVMDPTTRRPRFVPTSDAKKQPVWRAAVEKPLSVWRSSS